MVSELTTFCTVDYHDPVCKACTKCRHPTSALMPSINLQMENLRAKDRITNGKIRNLTFEVANLERRIRRLAELGREGTKSIMINRLVALSGLLHMFLRYSLILKQDKKRLSYMASQAGRAGPLPTLNFTDATESEMMLAAPDLGSLLIFDYYPAPDDELDEEGEDYSVIHGLFPQTSER